MSKRKSLKRIFTTLSFLAATFVSATVFAADGAREAPNDTLFILLGAVMILAMHAGFAFLEVGSVRKKNQVNALNKIICEWCFSTVVYFLIGYPLARGISFLVPINDMSNGNGLEYVKFFL